MVPHLSIVTQAAASLAHAIHSGMFLDLGKPFVGAWVGGGCVITDLATGKDIFWGAEFSQEGSILFGIDVDTGEEIERHEIGARQYSTVPDHDTGRLYVITFHGIHQLGNLLLVRRPETREIESCGFPPIPRNRFVGAIIGVDGKLYASTHTDAHLAAFDPIDETWTDFGTLAPPPTSPEQQTWLRGLRQFPNGEILGGLTRPPHTVLFDPKTREMRELPEFWQKSYIIEGDAIYVNAPSGIQVYNPEFQQIDTLTIASLTQTAPAGYPPETQLSVTLGDRRGHLYGWIGEDIVRINPIGKTLTKVATPARNAGFHIPASGRIVMGNVKAGWCAAVNPDTGKITQNHFEYNGVKATDICGLAKGPDNCIYSTDIIGMHVARYNSNTEELKDLGAVGWSGGEIYNLIGYDGLLYMGSYGGAIWGVYDPKRQWTPDPASQGTSELSNPRNSGGLGDNMNRPFEYVVGPDDKIYIACRANYGQAGGGLACFDPKSGEKTVYRDMEQSVQSVSADNRYVYGGTSIRGGRGWGEVTREGMFFVFDPEKRKRILEIVPVYNNIAVGSLTYSLKTDMVYGSTDNSYLFAFSPTERQVVQRWKLRGFGTTLMGVPEGHGIIHITTGSDGDVYGITNREVFKLDLSIGRVIYLDHAPIPDLYQIVEGQPGVFYIGARAHLLKYHLAELPHYR